MSVVFAGRQGVSSRRAQPQRLSGPNRDKPIGVTVRRAKFASILCIGGLMFGVISNAMLFQSGGVPGAPLTEVVQSPPVKRVAAMSVVRPDGPGDAAPVAPLAKAAVDPMPTGAIAAPAPVRPKSRTTPIAAKPSSRHDDGISAFLRAASRSVSAPVR